MAPKIIDASLIPLEKALLARAEALGQGARVTEAADPLSDDARMMRWLGQELRALVEELHSQ